MHRATRASEMQSISEVLIRARENVWHFRSAYPLVFKQRNFSSVHSLFIKNSVDNLGRKWYNIRKCRMRDYAKQNSTDSERE